MQVIGFHVLALSGDALFALGRSCKMWAAVTSDNGFWTLAVQSRFGSVAYTPASHLVAPASNAWDRAFYEREIAAGRLAPLPPPPCTAAAPNARAAKYTSAKHEVCRAVLLVLGGGDGSLSFWTRRDAGFCRRTLQPGDYK